MEILAPVGGREQLIAAVRSGCDAVYLGTKLFNARQNAENFGDELESAVAYCHGRGVKVHVTMNTLIMDPERPALLREAERIAKSGADAVIVQDLAVAQIFRECCPDMPMHASTQLTIHNLAGAMAAKELGFSRIVPARELSLGEIRTLGECGLEIECFVHGALCMCVSGQCYLSSMLGGRSGNRGLCAQPCRLDFNSRGRSYALSLKDMSHVEHIEALRDAGVCSLKIEGRMKRPEYVAAAVTACRDALEGKAPDMRSLRSVFSRSGFTDGYLTGKRELAMFGHRTKEDVESSAGVLGELAGLYRSERQSVPVSMNMSLSREGSVLTVSDGERTASVTGAGAEPAITRPTDAETLNKNLRKTGGTPFYLADAVLINEEKLALPPSEINALRRTALEKLLSEREKTAPKAFSPDLIEVPCKHVGGETETRLRFENPAQIPENCGERVIILPIEEINAELIAKYGDRLWGEMPAVVFPSAEEKTKKLLETLFGLGLRHAVAGNIGTVKLARSAGFTVHGGHTLNVLNSYTVCELQRMGLTDCTVSFEAALKTVRTLGGELKRGIIAYGYLPLMTFRACPAQSAKGCADCTGRSVLTDRKGIGFPLICHGKQYTTLLNSLPLHMAEKSMAGLDFIALYFTVEDRDACRGIIEDYELGRSSTENRTKGLYFRELR